MQPLCLAEVGGASLGVGGAKLEGVATRALKISDLCGWLMIMDVAVGTRIFCLPFSMQYFPT